MEHQNKDVNQVINQMQMIKFKGVFMAALELLKKEPVLLFALVLAPLLVNGILEGYVYPPLLGATFGAGAITAMLTGLVFALLSALISFFGSGLILRAASRVYDGKKVDVGETVDFVRTHFVDAVKLAIQLFVYTGAWIIIAYVLLTALMVPLAPGLALTLGALTPVVGIVYIIAFFKKIVNSSMSFAIFWSAEKPEIDGSLKRSLELCDNLTWTIFFNYLLMGLVGALASFVIVAVIGAILSGLGRGGMALTAAIASGVVGTFYALFQYCLKGQVEKFRGGHHQPEHHNEAPHDAHHGSHEGHSHNG